MRRLSILLLVFLAGLIGLALFAATCSNSALNVVVTPKGTTGSSPWGYVVQDGNGLTTEVVMTYSGAPALNTTNYNLVSWTATAGPYQVFRMVGGSAGLIAANGACSPAPCLNDKGQAADVSTQPSFSPTLAQYKSQLQAAMATMRAQSAKAPQPKPLLAGQAILSNAGVMTAGFPACTPDYGQSPSNACGSAAIGPQLAYIDMLKRAGVQVVDLNLDVIPLQASAEYVGGPQGVASVVIGNNGGAGCDATSVVTFTAGIQTATGAVNVSNGQITGVTLTAPGFYTTPPLATITQGNCQQPPAIAAVNLAAPLAHVCANGAGLADPPSTPSGSNYCLLLGVLDQTLAHAHAIGLKVRFSPAYSAFEGGQCNLTASSTEVDFENCFKPLYYAAAKRYAGWLDSFTPMHEPAGSWFPPGFALPTGLPPWALLDVESFYLHCRDAIKQASPNTAVGISIGTDLHNGETIAFWQDWIQNIPASRLDYLAIDLYSNSSDASQILAPGALTPAGCTPAANSEACTWSGGAFSLVQYLVSTGPYTSQSIGVPVRINESNRPVWVPNGCAPSGGNGIWDNSYPEWRDDGLDVAWQTALLRWAAAQGFTSVSQFYTPIWAASGYNSQNYNSLNTIAQYSLIPLGVGAMSQSGQAWALAASRIAAIEGTGHISAGKLGR